MTRDAEIQEEVIRELIWDPRVDESRITVAADDGVVTLTGTVESFAQRTAAQEATHRVAGVLDVADDLCVRVPHAFARADTDLAHAVRHALEWDARVPHERIRSSVTEGLISLEGEVESWHQREAAEHAVRNLAGVCGVLNRLAVLGPRLSADELREEIERALDRRAERMARRIDIRVEDGTVTLSGPVRSWSEKEAILGTVRHSPSVRAIDDRLRIEPAV